MSSPSELADVSAQRMRWEAPLSEEHAALLLQRLDLQPGASVLDLGCGWGELLLRAAASTEGIAAVGVDTDVASIERGRSLAATRELSRRVTFVEADAAAWAVPADRVMSVGASHAWDGGTVAAMQALTDAVRPGGRLLFGDMCFEAPPSPAAAEMFGDEALPLAELVEQARTLGWRVLHLSTADQREWDDFESTWRAGRQEWLLQHPASPMAGEVRERLDAQLRRYTSAYRGVLGFAYLVMAR